MLAVTDELRDEIVGEARTPRLRSLARQAGMASLADDARRAVAEGLTTPHQIRRLVHADPGVTLPCSVCSGQVPVGATACPLCGRPRRRACVCGASLEAHWRFCPQCVRPVPSGCTLAA